MNPVLDSQFLSSLSGCNVAIDACCLIDSVLHESLVGKFLFDLKSRDVGFYTTPGVVFEFFRGSDNEKSLEKRAEILKAVTDNFIVPIDKKFSEMTAFLMIMNKVTGKCGLGEYQLVATLVNHPNAFILTENHKDMPTDFLDRVSVVCFNLPKEIKNYAFYKLNEEKYQKIASRLLETN